SFGVALLLVPGETPAVAVQAGDHVVEAIAIDVIDRHLRAACAVAERDWMKSPGSRGHDRGLLPPAAILHHIQASVSIDIAYTEPVIRRAHVFRNDVRSPYRCRVGGIGAGPGDAARSAVDHFHL